MINSVKPEVREYIISEKFIWDDLLDRAAHAITVLKRMWKKKHKLPSMILSWPASAVKDDKGKTIDDVISLTVPDNITLSKAIRDMVVRTKPYALLVCDTRQQDVVKVFLESHHGARTWTIPVKRHGDVRVLEEESYKDNGECLGVLWRKTVGSD